MNDDDDDDMSDPRLQPCGARTVECTRSVHMWRAHVACPPRSFVVRLHMRFRLEHAIDGSDVRFQAFHVCGRAWLAPEGALRPIFQSRKVVACACGCGQHHHSEWMRQGNRAPEYRTPGFRTTRIFLSGLKMRIISVNGSLSLPG